ncbi:hypothetical protein LPJ64_001088 [Coemansia asiatica]|uniref:Calponin-homology (CH) domain-containing protein n=1 Tax=Coemansia asiatica TaxID=1052880 RepID=A0A9W7XQM3_9FUNG|nr:hypothetical protein LPJ64_001088 [Coemansia asiatica]KAJ2889015.1 hypothetical protein FB639_000215 [Coemansia asiatica]
MSQEDIAHGFVHWVGTFSSLSKPVSQLTDLTDGIALFEICAEIDRQWFKSIRSTDIGDNWILKMNNLKKLYKLVTKYYEDVLGYPASNLAEPNLAAIAKNEDPEELLKLCHLVLTLAVQCERNQLYIGKIMSLDEDDQRSLMVSIESVLAQLGSAEPDTEADSQDVDMMDVHRGNDDEDPVSRLQAELLRSYAEKGELERSAHDLSVEHKVVQSKYEELLVLNEELKMRMEDLEKSMARADKTGRADFLLRTEIENLKHDLEKADMRCQDAERINKEQNMAISELNKRLSESSEAKDEVVRLRDQLQEYKHAAERLAKSEHVIEKYKKKLEESTDLRRQVRSLEEQLAHAQDRSRQIEDEYRKMAQLRPTMDNYRGEFAQLESQHNQTVIELSQAMERLRNLEGEKERLHQDKQRDQELIASLEESLREMELTGAAAPGSASATLESGLASAMAADERSALLLKVARLERELEEAKSSAAAAAGSSSVDATGFLEEVAEAASREKDAALEELQQEREIRKRLESELAAHLEKLRNADMASQETARAKEDLKRVTEQLMSASSEISAVRSELAQAKQELDQSRASALATEQERNAAREALRRLDGSNEAANLRAENKSLEEWYAETHQQSQQFKAEIDRLSTENRSLLQKMSTMQEQLTHAEIRRREIESEGKQMAETLKRQHAELVSPNRYSQSDVEVLQKELVKSRNEVHTLQISLKRTKDHCLAISNKLKEAQVAAGSSSADSGSTQDNIREALLALQSQVALKDEQLNSMRDMLREQNNVHLLESRTMASAWFNLQRQLERQSGFGHSSGMGSAAASSRQGGAPASWLGQQRVTLDMQLNS